MKHVCKNALSCPFNDHFSPRSPRPPPPPRADPSMAFAPDAHVAAVVFSHLGTEPSDRVALAEVSDVFKDAEKTDASLPVPPDALYALGLRFEHGEEKKESDKALYWWRKAAERGDAAAMCDIGCCYFEGNVVPEDRTTAFCWFEKSASLGNDYATYRVGVCYELGLGVKQNVPKALQAYYDLATIFSYSHGAWALSEIYEHGRCGVPVDEEKARKWYRVFEDLRADEEASEEESDSDEEPETQTN